MQPTPATPAAFLPPFYLVLLASTSPENPHETTSLSVVLLARAKPPLFVPSFARVLLPASLARSDLPGRVSEDALVFESFPDMLVDVDAKAPYCWLLNWLDNELPALLGPASVSYCYPPVSAPM